MQKLSLLLLSLTIFVYGCNKESDPQPGNGTACIDSPEEATVNQTIEFTSCSQVAVSYLWDFGDGTTSNLTNPKHTYAEPGDYLVKLTVTDKDNEAYTTSVTIKVLASDGTDCQIHSNYITTSQTWKKGCHIVDGMLTIINGAVLTIEPGAVVKFRQHEFISVGYSEPGTIIAEGTAEEPIIFTSISETPAPGDWEGISIGGNTSSPAIFKHCIFEYGGLDLFGDPSSMVRIYDGGRVQIDHCEFRKSYGYAVEADYDGGFELFTNNNIHDINGFAILISGNYAGTIGEGNIIENKGVLINIDDVTMDTEWRGLTCPYVTASNLWVGSETGNTLTLGPGVRIEFQNTQMLLPASSTSIATLIANGTAENPVVLTAFDPAATRRWGGVVLNHQFTADSYFRHTIFEQAQSPDKIASVISVGATTLNMENCSISGDKQYGIIMGSDAKLGVFSNNDFGETGEYSINLRVQNLQKIGNGNTFSGNKMVDLAFGTVAEDVIFPALPVYYESFGLALGSPEGNTVTFEPGSKFLMFGEISVGEGYGAEKLAVTFNAVGTPENPIIIKGDIENPNLWLIKFIGSQISMDSRVEYCNISHGSIGIKVSYVENDPATPYPVIRNNTITDCGYGIYVNNSEPLIENNTYLNNEHDVYYQEY